MNLNEDNAKGHRRSHGHALFSASVACPIETVLFEDVVTRLTVAFVCVFGCGSVGKVCIRIRREFEACSYCAVKGAEPVMSKSQTPVTKSEILNIPAYYLLLLSSKKVYVTACSARTFACNTTCMHAPTLK